MRTPIDELLEDLRGREENTRGVIDEATPEYIPSLHAEADHLARQIAAVEELVKNQAKPNTAYGDPATAARSVSITPDEMRVMVERLVGKRECDGG